MTECEKAWERLQREVNQRRYRGVDRNEPMHDSYYWPLEIVYMADIAEAALRFVVAKEALATVEGKDATGQ